jgi:hypothetical protein
VNGLVCLDIEEGEGEDMKLASQPFSQKDFDSLHLEQRMMLVLERELRDDICKIVVDGEEREERRGEREEEGSKFKGDSSGTRGDKEGGGSIPETQKRSSYEHDASSDPPSNAKRCRVDHEHREGGEGEGEESTRSIGSLSASLLDRHLHILFRTHAQYRSSYNILEDLKPKKIIIVDPDIFVIRSIETYLAANPQAAQVKHEPCQPYPRRSLYFITPSLSPSLLSVAFSLAALPYQPLPMKIHSYL